MFDCRTNRTPIERLGSIGFDWFLVRFRSISYAGSGATDVIMREQTRQQTMMAPQNVGCFLRLVICEPEPVLSSQQVVPTTSMQPNNNIALNKYSSGTIPSVYSLWLFRPQYLSCILQLAGVDLIGFHRVYSVLGRLQIELIDVEGIVISNSGLLSSMQAFWLAKSLFKSQGLNLKTLGFLHLFPSKKKMGVAGSF